MTCGVDWEQDQWGRLGIGVVEQIGNSISGMDWKYNQRSRLGYLDQIGNTGELNWEQNERIKLRI